MINTSFNSNKKRDRAHMSYDSFLVKEYICVIHVQCTVYEVGRTRTSGSGVLVWLSPQARYRLVINDFLQTLTCLLSAACVRTAADMKKTRSTCKMAANTPCILSVESRHCKQKVNITNVEAMSHWICPNTSYVRRSMNKKSRPNQDQIICTY